MVIVVQGRTIETQRELIQTLFVDSSELNKLRSENQDKLTSPTNNANPADAKPAPATPQPGQGAGSATGPASQPGLKEKMRPRSFAPTPNSTPNAPALSPHQFDAVDVRRNLRVI